MAYQRGLIPLDGAGNGQTYTTETMAVLTNYATDLFVGDPVLRVAAGLGTPGTTNYPNPYNSAVGGASFALANVAADGGVIYGVITSVHPTRTDLTKQYLPASTGGFITVARPTSNTVFKVGSDSGGDQIELIDVNNQYDLEDQTGSTVTGYSGFVIDSSSEATTSKQVYLVGAYNNQQDLDTLVDDGGAGQQNVIWLVTISEIQMALGIVGVGV